MAKIRNRKLNKKKIVFFILLIIIGTYCVSNIMDYKVIKLDKNSNYSGIGQKKIKNKDGYFTTFTTEDNYKKTYKEYKQNGSSSWANNEYL